MLAVHQAGFRAAVPSRDRFPRVVRPGGDALGTGGFPATGGAQATDGAGAGGGEDAAAGAAGAPPCPIRETEWCDQVDNDCDGKIDNGEVCPDDTVANTETFTDAVYLVGTTVEGTCSYDAIQRVWPFFSEGYYTGFYNCYADLYTFRMTDAKVFYTTYLGVYEDQPGNGDTLVLTPPCGDGVAPFFSTHTLGFDGTGTMYYQCDDTVRRGNGTFIADSVERFYAALADGRSIVTRTSATGEGEAFVVLGKNGAELARLDVQGEFSGEIVPDWNATSVAGNQGYVAFRRTLPQEQYELVVYRVTADNVWQRVRRLPLATFGYWTLVISDGTVFVRRYATASEEEIVAFRPDGTEQVVWSEAEHTAVRSHGRWQLLVGPN